MVEGPIDLLANSIRYSVSNPKSIAIWGGIYLLTLILAFTCFIIGYFFLLGQDSLKDGGIPGLTIILAGLIPAVLGGILVTGFICQCIRTLLSGESVTPIGLDNPWRLIKDGICVTIISFVGAIIGLILMIPGFALMYYSSINKNDTLLLVGLVIFMLSLIPYILLLFLSMIQWVIYVDSEHLSQGLNFLKSIGLILSHPLDAAIAIILVFVLQLVQSAICFVLEIPVCTMILFPFVAVLGYIATYYIFTRFYQKTTGNYDIKPPGSGEPDRPEGSNSPHML